MPYPLLFSPIHVNKLALKNRIIFPSMVTGYAAINGEVTDRLVHYHAARAKGGCGLNMVEATTVSQNGNSYVRGLSMASDNMVTGMRRLCQSIHSKGGKAGIQLMHGGRTVNTNTSRHPIPLVSYIPGMTPFIDSVVMSEEDIVDIVNNFAAAAKRSVEAGFDLIELHGAHGYLIQQFMSPLTNTREDKYGGSYEARMRFPLEVLAAVRKAVGQDYPVAFRFSVEEFLPGGIEINLACRIAKTMVNAGLDALNVSVGLGETNFYTVPPSSISTGWNAERALAVKQAVEGKIPVAVVGRIKSATIAEDILASGKADMVVMGRALIADPCLPVKAQNGLATETLPCVACNEGCISRLGQGQDVACAVNPRAGREALFPVLPAKTAKKVLIVGGGPAGMQAALTAAERGHAAILHEKNGALGGLLNVAALPPNKSEYAELVHFYEKALLKAGVSIHLNSALGAAEAAEINADAILVCTGSVPVRPGFCNEVPVRNIQDAQDVLCGTPVGKRVLILGGGMVGSECAEFLAEQGKEVTVLEMREDLALDMEGRTRRLFMPRLKGMGVKSLLQCQVQRISPAGEITLLNAFKHEQTLPAYDTLILALGYRPENTLYEQLLTLGMPAQALGDCRQPGKVIQAVRQGFEAAYAL